MAKVVMIKVLFTIVISALMTPVIAASSTALYQVETVMRIVKSEKTACDDTEAESCKEKQIGYWKVIYKATSPYSPVQKHEVKMPDNPPQVGMVTQLTVSY